MERVSERAAHEPAQDIHIESSPAPGGSRWDAFAAMRLSEIHSCDASKTSASVSGLYQRQVDLLQTLWTDARDIAFELRYSFFPEGGARPGRVEAALRLRASAPEREAAVAAAREAARGLFPLIRVFSSDHQWSPVLDAGEYAALFQPMEFRHCAEVVRQQLRIPVPSECAPEAAASARWVRLVRSFNPRLDSWERLFASLLAGPSPVALSVAVAPTRLEEGEAAWLRTNAAVCEAAARGEPDPESGIFRAYAEAAAAQLAESLRVLTDKAYLLRVQLASPEPLWPGLAESVGTAVSDPPDAPEMRNPVHTEARLVRGGFAVARPDGIEQAEAALKNLRRVGFDRWGPPESSSVRRLDRLAGAAEAAAAFRLPAPIAGPFPGLPTQTARIVDCRVETDDEGTVLGLAPARGGRRPVRIGLDDRRRHLYVVGQTGTGKTTLLHSLAIQDIRAGHGVCILDPHGDLAARVHADMPSARRKDLVFVDFSDPRGQAGLNVFDACVPDRRDLVVSLLMEAFEQLYDMRQAGGPMFEMYMRAAMLLALSGEGKPTLLDIQRVLCDKAHRKQCLARSDDVVRAAWSDCVEEAGGESSLPNMKPYVLSKLNRFLHDGTLRRILCGESTLDFAAAMAQRKVLLVHLGKGALGPGNSSFLGMLASIQLVAAALARPHADAGLADFFVYVDEFQNFTTPSFATLLAEARKFRVNLALANQHTGQLAGEVGRALLGNVGGLVAFRTGPVDAKGLAEYFAPQFEPADLMGLPVGRACASLLVNGAKAAPFTLEACPPPAPPVSGPEPEVDASARLRQWRRRSPAGTPKPERSQKLGAPASCEVLPKIRTRC